jgi:hypothetical protein
MLVEASPLVGRKLGLIPSQKWPSGYWLIASLLSAASFFTSNSLLGPAALVILTLGARMLIRLGEPPVLAFAFGVQWLQASIAIFHADYYQVPLSVFFGSYESEVATWLSLIGVFALALGMKVGLLGAVRSRREPVAPVNIPSVFIFYAVTFAIGSALEAVSFKMGGLSQPIHAVVGLRIAVLYVVFFAVLQQQRHYLWMLLVLMIESAVGFLGYFAGFKTAFFVLLIAASTSKKSFSGRRRAFNLSIATAVILLSVIWSAIKAEYRQFLNRGTDTQQVLVSIDERLDNLADTAGSFSSEQFSNGFEELLQRISYVKLFASCIANVPDKMPHEQGQLWLDAMKHVLMPRILFPNKPALDDSEETTKYTGLAVAGTEQGTSIGIGYMAESYIDFGRYGMFVPVFFLGIGYGLIYRCFMSRETPSLADYAFGVAVLLPAMQDFALSTVKIVGGDLMLFGAALLAAKVAKARLPNLA